MILDRKIETMSSKERVLKTFKREKTDRLPINYFANLKIDKKIKEYFGLDIKDNEGLYKKLGVDFRALEAPYVGKPLFYPDEIDIKNNFNVDPITGIRTKWVQHGSGGYNDFVRFPLKNATLEEIRNWPFPNPDDFDYTKIDEICEKFKDYAIYVGNAGLGDNMNSAGMLFSQQEVYLNMALKGKALLYYMDKRTEYNKEIIKRTMEKAKGKVDIVWIGEDLGTQKGPLISLDMFRDLIKPKLKVFTDLAVKYGAECMVHSCGSSSWAFNDFIDMGVTAVDTLQPEAEKMNPKYLVKTFGDKLVYHGCISTAGPLAYGNAKDVRENCYDTYNVFEKIGGYCMAPTHSIQDNSPLENVLSMYDSVYEYSKSKSNNV